MGGTNKGGVFDSKSIAANNPRGMKQQEGQKYPKNVSLSKCHGVFKIFSVDTEVLKHASCEVSKHNNGSGPVPSMMNVGQDCDSRYENREICLYPSINGDYVYKYFLKII